METTTERIPTTMHAYRFKVGDPEYSALAERLEKENGRCFRVFGETPQWFDTGRDYFVHLETEHVFGDQWNTGDSGDFENRRLMDWYEDAQAHGNGWHVGYYLDVTDRMREIRAHRLVCGYCGAQYGEGKPAPHPDGFCHKCVGSEYLKPTELHLLRLVPAGASFGADRSGDIPDDLRDEYRAQPGKAKSKRIEAERARALQRAKEAVEDAETEYRAKVWLAERDLPIDNVIRYGHKVQNGDRGVFCFGWRTPLTEAERAQLLDVLAEFPWQYELK